MPRFVHGDDRWNSNGTSRRSERTSGNTAWTFKRRRQCSAIPFERTILDPDHSAGEYRFLSLGVSSSGRALVVSYTERRDDRLRIIGARLASRRERRQYEPRS